MCNHRKYTSSPPFQATCCCFCGCFRCGLLSTPVCSRAARPAAPGRSWFSGPGLAPAVCLLWRLRPCSGHILPSVPRCLGLGRARPGYRVPGEHAQPPPPRALGFCTFTISAPGLGGSLPWPERNPTRQTHMACPHRPHRGGQSDLGAQTGVGGGGTGCRWGVGVWGASVCQFIGSSTAFPDGFL